MTFLVVEDFLVITLVAAQPKISRHCLSHPCTLWESNTYPSSKILKGALTLPVFT